MKYMHEVNLGEGVDLEAVLKDQRRNPLVRAVLQHIRNEAAGLDRLGRIMPEQAASVNARDPLEWRAFHAGAANALEELFFKIAGTEGTEGE